MLLIWLMKWAELFQLDAGSLAAFIALSVLMFIFVYAAVQLSKVYTRYYDRRVNERELKIKAMQNEVQLLKAQIEPHFLFNTLNCISATVPPQHEATRKLISRLADTFRYALRSTKEEMVPLCDELAFIGNYLELEKERFGNRLQIRIATEGIGDVMIAPMLLQPLVENAIEHGIAPAVKGGTVSISCCRDGNRMLISVSDDAVPFKGELNKLLCCQGVGLKNTALRIERIYRQKIRIQRNNPGGLIFSFAIPLTDQEGLSTE